MPAGSADRNRSPIVNVTTPRGRIDAMHQEMRGLGSRSGWHKFWLARRTGTHDWAEATTPREGDSPGGTAAGEEDAGLARCGRPGGRASAQA
jgi:hypothetical protein